MLIFINFTQDVENRL